MSRPLRIEYPNAFYHVMNRGAGRQVIFHIDDDYEMFLEALKESSRFFGIRIISFCLMSHHDKRPSDQKIRLTLKELFHY